MKRQPLILAGFTFVCGTLVGLAGGIYGLKHGEPQSEPVETVTVLMAGQQICHWSPIKEPDSLFEEQEIPKHEAPKGYVRKDEMEELKGRIIREPLRKHEILTLDHLVGGKERPARYGDEWVISQQLRFFCLETPSAASRSLRPGSRVDVIYTPRTGTDDGKAKVVLEDRLVAAVVPHPFIPEQSGALPNVTLLINVEEVLEISRLWRTGTFTLAERPPGDKGTVKTQPVAPPKEP